MSETTIEIETRMVPVRGITLPWKRIEQWGPIKGANGAVNHPERPPKGTVLESGEVFITMSDLHDLAEQDVWDSQFGKVLLLGAHEGYALQQAGLAVQETRGGYHRSEKLMELMRAWGEI